MYKKIARIGLVTATAFILAGVGAISSGAATGWSYTGTNGPSHWASIDPINNAKCADVDKSAQSPINITKTVKRALPNLEFDYTAGEAGIFNNGHTVEAEPLGEEESTVTIGGVVYPFAQLHFHAPSEHEINGLHYPVEVHFVHKADSGKLAVVGVFIKAGSRTNAAWQPFIEKINSATSDPEETVIDLDWKALLPANQQTIRYSGSLTTPGCAEGVKWNVFTNPVILSQTQINQFLEAYSGNNRPVQPLHGRKITLDSTVTK